MSTITFDLPSSKAESFCRVARERGLDETEPARQVVLEFVDRNETVQSATDYVLKKNEELYRRLAK